MDDPVDRIAMRARHEFSEYGGVQPSIDVSTTFTGEVLRAPRASSGPGD
jgi:hypothetical protein